MMIDSNTTGRLKLAKTRATRSKDLDEITLIIKDPNTMIKGVTNNDIVVSIDGQRILALASIWIAIQRRQRLEIIPLIIKDLNPVSSSLTLAVALSFPFIIVIMVIITIVVVV